jgi:HlyD family secretion protein
MRHTLTRMKRKEVCIVGGVCFVLLVILLYFYFGQQGKGAKVKISKGNPLVETYMVKRSDMMRHISLSGQTVADANISLAPKYTGRIIAVNVKLGDKVKAGDILLLQDMGDLDISINQNRVVTRAAAADAVEAEATYNANYIKAQNAYELQKMKYERNQYLFSIGAISQNTLDEIEQEYMTSKAAFEILENQTNESSMPASVESKRLAVDKAAYGTEALEKQREDMILRAPRDGVIGYRAAEVGAIASAGTKVFSLVDNHHIYIDCAISESDAAVLQPGMPMAVGIDALGNTYAGALVYVSPAMDDSAKTYTARIELNDMDLGIKAGLFARSQIDILQRPQTLFVPKEAVVTKNGLTSLFVVKNDKTVESHDVRIGLINDMMVEIIDGVADDDVVVLSNQEKLKNGTTVDLADSGEAS